MATLAELPDSDLLLAAVYFSDVLEQSAPVGTVASASAGVVYALLAELQNRGRMTAAEIAQLRSAIVQAIGPAPLAPTAPRTDPG